MLSLFVPFAFSKDVYYCLAQKPFVGDGRSFESCYAVKGEWPHKDFDQSFVEDSVVHLLVDKNPDVPLNIEYLHPTSSLMIENAAGVLWTSKLEFSFNFDEEDIVFKITDLTLPVGTSKIGFSHKIMVSGALYLDDRMVSGQPQETDADEFNFSSIGFSDNASDPPTLGISKNSPFIPYNTPSQLRQFPLKFSTDPPKIVFVDLNNPPDEMVHSLFVFRSSKNLSEGKTEEITIDDLFVKLTYKRGSFRDFYFSDSPTSGDESNQGRHKFFFDANSPEKQRFILYLRQSGSLQIGPESLKITNVKIRSKGFDVYYHGDQPPRGWNLEIRSKFAFLAPCYVTSLKGLDESSESIYIKQCKDLAQIDIKAYMRVGLIDQTMISSSRVFMKEPQYYLTDLCDKVTPVLYVFGQITTLDTEFLSCRGGNILTLDFHQTESPSLTFAFPSSQALSNSLEISVKGQSIGFASPTGNVGNSGNVGKISIKGAESNTPCSCAFESLPHLAFGQNIDLTISDTISRYETLTVSKGSFVLTSKGSIKDIVTIGSDRLHIKVNSDFRRILKGESVHSGLVSINNDDVLTVTLEESWKAPGIPKVIHFLNAKEVNIITPSTSIVDPPAVEGKYKSIQDSDPSPPKKFCIGLPDESDCLPIDTLDTALGENNEAVLLKVRAGTEENTKSIILNPSVINTRLFTVEVVSDSMEFTLIHEGSAKFIGVEYSSSKVRFQKFKLVEEGSLLVTRKALWTDPSPSVSKGQLIPLANDNLNNIEFGAQSSIHLQCTEIFPTANSDNNYQIYDLSGISQPTLPRIVLFNNFPSEDDFVHFVGTRTSKEENTITYSIDTFEVQTKKDMKFHVFDVFTSGHYLLHTDLTTDDVLTFFIRSGETQITQHPKCQKYSIESIESIDSNESNEKGESTVDVSFYLSAKPQIQSKSNILVKTTSIQNCLCFGSVGSCVDKMSYQPTETKQRTDCLYYQSLPKGPFGQDFLGPLADITFSQPEEAHVVYIGNIITFDGKMKTLLDESMKRRISIFESQSKTFVISFSPITTPTSASLLDNSVTIPSVIFPSSAESTGTPLPVIFGGSQSISLDGNGSGLFSLSLKIDIVELKKVSIFSSIASSEKTITVFDESVSSVILEHQKTKFDEIESTIAHTLVVSKSISVSYSPMKKGLLLLSSSTENYKTKFEIKVVSGSTPVLTFDKTWTQASDENVATLSVMAKDVSNDQFQIIVPTQDFALEKTNLPPDFTPTVNPIDPPEPEPEPEPEPGPGPDHGQEGTISSKGSESLPVWGIVVIVLSVVIVIGVIIVIALNFAGVIKIFGSREEDFLDA